MPVGKIICIDVELLRTDTLLKPSRRFYYSVGSIERWDLNS